jgi:Holliday junction resolvasome RuvABC DNA-binding subunit
LVPQSSTDAIAALLTLGYSEKEAKEKVEKARSRSNSASTEELVRAVLQM